MIYKKRKEHIKNLKEKIKQAEKEKQKIISYNQGLKNKFLNNEIGYEYYKDIAKQKHNGKTLLEWFEHYENYIKECEKNIIKHEKKILKNNISIIIASLFIFILLFISLNYLQLTGLTIGGDFLNETNLTESTNITNENITEENITSNITIPETNITEINVTETNLTEFNITEANITQTNITETISSKENVTSEQLETQESIEKSQIIINQPVKWKKKITSNRERILSTTISSQAKNIIVKEGKEKIDITSKTQIKPILDKREIVEIESQDSALEFEIEYETPAPIATEEQISETKKIVIVSASDELNYTNVLTYTSITEKVKIGNEQLIKIKWIENNSFIDFKTLDTNNNNFIDKLEWTVPHLSNQTFEIIIEISKADHLDKNRNFISNIYEQVKSLDNIWSEEIPNQHYIRVTFEKNLTSKRDITIFPRIISGNPRIEIYEQNQNTKIAEFTNIQNNQYNKVFLTNLQSQSQDIFDLQILNGGIEFDHIVDPAILELSENCFDLTDWTISGTWTSTGGSCQAKNTGNVGHNMTSATLDLSGETNANLSFTYTTTGLDTGEYFKVYANNGTRYYLLLTVTANEGPIAKTIKLEDSIKLTSTVNIRAQCKNSANTEKCDWDNINVTSFDDIIPLLEIIHPANNTNSSNLNLNINYTVSDTNLQACWWTNSSELNNRTVTCGTNLTSEVWGEGLNNITIYTNDTTNNINSSSITFRIDTLPPYFNPILTNFELTNGNSFNYDINATDTGVATLGNFTVNDSKFIVNETGWLRNISAISTALYYLNIIINDTVGNQNSSIFYVNVTAPANNIPEIVNIFNTTFSSGITLNLGSSNTNITVNFSVFDADGASDLNDATAQINLTRAGETTRFNTTCSNPQTAGNYANYSCLIALWWFDSDGPWTIRASINDLSSNQATNTSANLTINTLTGFTFGPGNITFSTINPGSSNNTATNDPIILNNTGNQNIFRGGIEINSTSLEGEITSSQALYSGNFSVGNSTGVSNPECDIPQGTAANMTVVSGNAFAAVNSTLVNATLMRGNYTVNDGTGQEQLYICLRTAGSELSQQAYSFKNLGPWTIRITALFTSIIPASKKRKKKSNIKDDNLVKAIRLILDELSEKYSLTKEETTNILINEISDKYHLNRKEVIDLIESRKKDIPITIFSKELGALEALCKYMKENLNMNYKEISKLLNRDQRTIWTAYKKSKEKYPKALEIKKTEILLPIEIFNKDLTILESIIIYLKEKGFRNSEIAKLIERDQRNIQSIYFRIVKKLKRNV